MPLKVTIPDRPLDPVKIENGGLYAFGYGPGAFVGMAVEDGDKQSFLVLREVGMAVLNAELPTVFVRAMVQPSGLHELNDASLELPESDGGFSLPASDWQAGDIVLDSAGRTYFVVSPPRGYKQGFAFGGFDLLFFDAITGKVGRPVRPVSAYGDWRIVRREPGRDGRVSVVVEHRRLREQ